MAEKEKESWAKQLAGRFVVALAVKVVWAAVTRIGLRDDVI
ncbi:hypothetical protein AB0M29_18840 [Streptomyces sp. NPDC051976]